MKDYSAMSDFDIQQAVLQETWGKHPVRLLGKMMLDIMLSDYDPCNKPADAWPIIAANEISLLSNWNEDGVWGATVTPWNSYEHTNPLRAAMIVFLQMRKSEKGHG